MTLLSTSVIAEMSFALEGQFPSSGEWNSWVADLVVRPVLEPVFHRWSGRAPAGIVLRQASFPPSLAPWSSNFLFRGLPQKAKDDQAPKQGNDVDTEQLENRALRTVDFGRMVLLHVGGSKDS